MEDNTKKYNTLCPNSNSPVYDDTKCKGLYIILV